MNYSEEFIRQKIWRINEIFKQFCREIDSLKKEQSEIIEKIFERIDKEKIEKILKEIKK